MQESRIEQKIEDIYGFVESCKMQSFSTTKVIVPKNDLYDLLDDLRRDIPEEIKRYRKMLNQRDAILEDAKRKASEILTDAQDQYAALIEEHSIMQEAYQQAEETVRMANEQAAAIVESATKQANEIGNGAIYYTTDMLANAEKVIAQAYETTVNNSKALETALSGYLEIIRRNRAELVPVESQTQYEEPQQVSQEEAAAYQSEFAPEEEQ